jgi:hypothetical protein
VVNVTVDQSTNLVVDPDSLSIPANGAESFKVKLAKAPTAPVTVTVTTSTPNLTTTPASLTFTPTNFNIDQAVLVSTESGAVPGAQSVLLKAGPLGQFKLPVTITPASKNPIFFIDPVNGKDGFPGTGTAAKPWQTVASALNSSQPSGSQVAAVASAGNDVVVTILAGGPENVGVPGINTPILSAGSVTVLKAPSAGTFTLNMGSNQLILNKGYKLQDIQITSNPSTAAVEITHPTAGLASVDVTCNMSANNAICVKVEGAGFHTLEDVRVDVIANSKTNTIGIKSVGANATLSIVGGRVQPADNTQSITLIDAQGVLTVTDLTVNMTNAGHALASTGIVLQAPGSFVTGSTINVSNNASAIGINVQNTASPSTVEGNTFIGSGLGIGVNGNVNLSSNALLKNNFSGTFTNKVQ